MFESLLTALDKRRAEFLEGLDSVPPAQRDRAPSTQAWSPLQIGEHLVLVEHGLARIMARQVEKGEDRRQVGEPSEKSVEGLIRALRTPAKMKVPENVGVDPAGEMTMEELRAKWLAAGKRWHELAVALPPGLADEALVMHAVGGPLTFAQTLRFLEAHIEHHLFQLARTVRALNAAPA
jgi:hypothetical protein